MLQTTKNSSNLTLVQDVTAHLSTCFDKTNLTVQIPSAFSDLKNLNKDYEMHASPLVKHTNLAYSENLVEHSVAHIFVNTECRSQIGKLS